MQTPINKTTVSDFRTPCYADIEKDVAFESTRVHSDLQKQRPDPHATMMPTAFCMDKDVAHARLLTLQEFGRRWPSATLL
ncbi:hypothetical protein OPT61_g6203 [Boeremia exigua]|uniref:Uncharacterized protein n=1 Tax=Boeremia exigua TaxID=749465 RepID=A0ACC2I7J2_9PLEO|nr:hypothetical protein OPT61_g6203 [Boeremia exigua]